jgi:hypothetical protein
MGLTPEQFNKIATKEDLNNVRQEIINNTVGKQEFHEVMDSVIKKLDTIEHAFVSNMAAHDRFNQRITKIEQHLGLNQYDVINK